MVAAVVTVVLAAGVEVVEAVAVVAAVVATVPGLELLKETRDRGTGRFAVGSLIGVDVLEETDNEEAGADVDEALSSSESLPARSVALLTSIPTGVLIIALRGLCHLPASPFPTSAWGSGDVLPDSVPDPAGPSPLFVGITLGEDRRYSVDGNNLESLLMGLVRRIGRTLDSSSSRSAGGGTRDTRLET